MTIETLGMIATLASLIAAIACLTWATVRLFSVRRRVSNITGRKSIKDIGAIGAAAEAIALRLQDLEVVSLRFAQIRDDVAEAVAASAVLAANVRAVAAATETLLEATLPSMRGYVADSG